MKMKLFLCVVAASLCATSTHAAVVEFQSGNGWDLNNDNVADPYQPDQKVRFVPYHNHQVPNFPSEADFEAIRNFDQFKPRSVAATIVPQTINGWLTGSPTTQTAAPVFNLVSSNIYGDRGASSLFGIPLDLTDQTVTGGHLLNFNFQADNYLGFNASLDLDDDYEESVPGLYLNGIPLAGSIVHSLDPEERFAKANLRLHVEDELISNEVNYLYMLVTDLTPSSGIVFSGELVPNPEPATLVIWSALGIIGLTIGIRRRRR